MVVIKQLILHVVHSKATLNYARADSHVSARPSRREGAPGRTLRLCDRSRNRSFVAGPNGSSACRMSAVQHTGTTGVAELDRALGGLYWGDNVVWDAEAAADVGPFYAAAAAKASEYDAAAYVTLTAEPEALEAAYPGFDVLDARPAGDLAPPRPLLEACGRWCAQPGRRLLLLESLDAMSDRWGTETAGRFFMRGCPMLLGLGAVAFWSLTTSRHPPALRREIEDVTQCVLSLGDGRVRIIKAEGRRAGVEGSVFRYHVDEGMPVLEPAPAAARLGAALRDLRRTRRLTQADIARLAGVSPSAISQAERGRRGLSLETLLDLTSRLNMTLDELLRGQEAPATASPAETIPARRRSTSRYRSSTTRGRASVRTSCACRPALALRRRSRTRASSSSPSRRASCRSSSRPERPSYVLARP